MKQCTKCHIFKEEYEFRNDNRKIGRLYCQCRLCESQHKKEQYLRKVDFYKQAVKTRKQERMKWLQEYKKGCRCSKCGDNRHYVLDFHHKDAKQKLGNLTRLAANCYSKEKLLSEIAKCDVLCSNCHRELHYFERINGNIADEVIAPL